MHQTRQEQHRADVHPVYLEFIKSVIGQEMTLLTGLLRPHYHRNKREIRRRLMATGPGPTWTLFDCPHPHLANYSKDELPAVSVEVNTFQHWCTSWESSFCNAPHSGIHQLPFHIHTQFSCLPHFHRTHGHRACPLMMAPTFWIRQPRRHLLISAVSWTRGWSDGWSCTWCSLGCFWKKVQLSGSISVFWAVGFLLLVSIAQPLWVF